MDETSVASPMLCCHDYFHRFSNALFGELYNTAADIATCSNMKEKTLKEKKTWYSYLFSFQFYFDIDWFLKQEICYKHAMPNVLFFVGSHERN